MEKIVLDSAIKFGAGRYRQGVGVIDEVGDEVARFGKKAFIVSGPRAWAAVEVPLTKSFETAGISFEHQIYEGWCNYESAKEYASKCVELGCDEVVGVGGGKIMDFSKAVMTLGDNKIDLFSAFSIAKYTYEVLEQYGPQAIEDNRNHKVTKALEDVIYISIALTGVIANITQSFSQSAITHSIYDGVRTHFLKEAALALHGEIVAVGLFAQLHYNKLDHDMEALKEYMRGMDMPLSWEELGIPATEDNLQIIEDYLIDSSYVATGEDSLALLHEAVYKMV